MCKFSIYNVKLNLTPWTLFFLFFFVFFRNQKKFVFKNKNKTLEWNSTATVSVGPPSSACPKSESRNSALRSRSWVADESRDRVWSHDDARLRSRSRFRSLLRRWLTTAANNGWTSLGTISRSGLRPCCARYKSALLIRFCGGGVRWFFRSSGNSHGNEVDVYFSEMFI